MSAGNVVCFGALALEEDCVFDEDSLDVSFLEDWLVLELPFELSPLESRLFPLPSLLALGVSIEGKRGGGMQMLMSIQFRPLSYGMFLLSWKKDGKQGWTK